MRDPREVVDEEERVREVAQAEGRVRGGQFLRSVERMRVLYCQSVLTIREEERVRQIAQAEGRVRGGKFLRNECSCFIVNLLLLIHDSRA